MTNPIFTDDYEVLIEVLAATRRRAGVSQRSLAAQLGKSQSHVNMIEQRQRRLELREFYLICRCLGVDPVEVFRQMVEGLDQRRAA